MIKKLGLAFVLVFTIATSAFGADRIVVLSSDAFSQPGLLILTTVNWYPVDPTKALPRPGATSSYPDAPSQINQQLQSGVVIEEVRTLAVADGDTPAQIQDALNRAWLSRKAYLDSKTKPGEHYSRTMNDQGVWRPKYCIATGNPPGCP